MPVICHFAYVHYVVIIFERFTHCKSLNLLRTSSKLVVTLMHKMEPAAIRKLDDNDQAS
jgi:hypothetical protein